MILYNNYIIKRSITNENELELYIFCKDTDQFYHTKLTEEQMKLICKVYTIGNMLDIIDSCCVDFCQGCELSLIPGKDEIMMSFRIRERFTTNCFSINIPKKVKTDTDEVNLALSEFMKRLDELGVKSESVDISISKLKEEFENQHRQHIDEMKSLINKFKGEMNTEAYLLRPSEITLPDCLARIPIDIKRLILDGRVDNNNHIWGCFTINAPAILESYNFVDTVQKPNSGEGYEFISDGRGDYLKVTNRDNSHSRSSSSYKLPVPNYWIRASQNFNFDARMHLPFSPRWFDPSKTDANVYPVINFTHHDINPLALLEDLEDLEIRNNSLIENWSPIYDLNLKSLTLDNCDMTDKKINHMLKNSRWFKSLEAINLKNNKGITDLRIFTEMPELKRICYKDTGVKNDVCLGNYPHIEIAK